MRRSRWASHLVLVVVALGLLASPAAAQSVNRAAIDDLNEQLLYVALPLTLFVEVTLVYAVYRFRNNDDPRPTVDDPALEITWTAATGAILVFVGVSAFFVLSNPYISPAAASAADPGGELGAETEIEVLAYQWGWEFHYPEANVTTQNRVVIPHDRDVLFRLTSADVIHSLYVPKLGLKEDVFPGQETLARTRATRTGSYRLYCAELCGSGHARMQATVVVVSQSEYDAWLAEQRASNGTAAAENGTARVAAPD